MVNFDVEKKVSIVIPFYNEEEGLNPLLDRIEDYYLKRKFDFDVIFVDDGSTDESRMIIENRRNLSFKYKLIIFSKNFGSHAALRAGFQKTANNYSTWLPADLQVSFDTVENLFKTSLEGFDVVYGVRESIQSSFFEKLFSRFYSSIMRNFVNKSFPLKGIETIFINRKILDLLNQNIESNSSIALHIMSLGFKEKFIDINKVERDYGKSKWTLSKKIKLLIDSFIGFSFAPIRLVTMIGFSFFIIGLIWTIYIVSRKIIYNDIVSGWTALTSILLLGFGITNICLGIIAEYLWRTLDASRKRPTYIIQEVIDSK